MLLRCFGHKGPDVERLERHLERPARVARPFLARAIAIQLDPVVIRIGEIDRLTHAMIRRTMYLHAGLKQAPNGPRQILARWIANSDVIQPGVAGGRGRPAEALPGVETDVMVIAAGGDEGGLTPVPLHQLETEDVDVKGERAFQVGHLEVHVADIGSRGNAVSISCLAHSLCLQRCRWLRQGRGFSYHGVPESLQAGDALTMSFHDRPTFPRGFRSASRNCGLKPHGKDLALFASDTDCAAAALFTRNQFPGAPIVLGRETIRAGRLRAIVANSKCSNVATGDRGLENARRMAAAAAGELRTTADRVLVSSTGVIGVQLPIEKIESGLRGMSADLTNDPLVGAEGIMTTDTHPKALSASVGDCSITWVAKGSGMIEPNLATMLVYIFTDASLGAAQLDRMLRDAAHVSFNMLSVDTDTSTSDTCVLMANGQGGGGKVDEAEFTRVLTSGCVRMTEMLARDGEGARHLLRVTVRGAANEREARQVAKSLVNSPLVKTMVHGADPNVGRLLMAVGKCFDCTVRQESTDAWINGHSVVRGGLRIDFDEAALRTALATEVIDIGVSLGVGVAGATAYGCDLTAGYIEENAAYYSS